MDNLVRQKVVHTIYYIISNINKSTNSVMLTALFKVTAPLVALALSAPSVLAQVIPSQTAPPPMPRNTLDINGVLRLMVRVANILIAFVAIISVIMVVWGGFRYATSSGDPAKVTSARQTLTYGIIGLVVALLAFAVISFANSLVGVGAPI